LLTVISEDFVQAHTYLGHGYEKSLAPYATLLTALTHRAATWPNDPYLTTISPDGEDHTISFGEFEARTSVAAHWLRTDLEVAAGDVVGLIPANDLDAVVLLVGVLRSGSACLLLNPRDPAARLLQQAAAQKARVVLRSPSVRTDHSAFETVEVPQIHARTDRQLLAHQNPDPLADALLFGTSGSTATSKIVAQSHRNAVTNAEAIRRLHHLDRGDRLLGFLPIYHANAVHLTLFATLYAGAHAILPHAFDPLGAGTLIERFRPRIVSGVPPILEALLQTWRKPVVPNEMDYFISAAAPLSKSTAAAVQKTLGCRILQGYGLTETTNFATMMPPELVDEVYRRLMVESPIPSIGVAMFGNHVAVLDEGSNPLPPGRTGEICIRGHNVMDRYCGNTAATAEAFRDGWFHSADTGFEVEEAGRRFVVVTGRTKNIAKVRGEAVSLDELERALRSMPGVQDAVCFCVPDIAFGERVIAAVSFGPNGYCEVLPALRSVLPPNAIPDQVLAAEQIPRTPTGKIMRRELAEQLGLPLPGIATPADIHAGHEQTSAAP
jgi:acyl-CoA synthetase (AMP-forming)/AMP-acid ligase II